MRLGGDGIGQPSAAIGACNQNRNGHSAPDVIDRLEMVPRMGFDPMISTLKGWRPNLARRPGHAGFIVLQLLQICQWLKVVKPRSFNSVAPRILRSFGEEAGARGKFCALAESATVSYSFLSGDARILTRRWWGLV